MVTLLASIRAGEKVGPAQADKLLPAKNHQTLRGDAHTEPEKRLMLAVLEDAIACFQKYLHARTDTGKRTFRGAEEWIMEENSGWPFSFENICEALRLNPNYVRQGLLHWKMKNCRSISKPGNAS